MLVLFFLWITHQNSQWSGAVGRQFFSKVLWIDLFVLSVIGLSYFASAITEEKESETLGLLRMTNLSALSILMGKSTSRLLGALFILAAQLPFMLVSVTMGGLAVRQVFAGAVCLFGYVFLLSNVGLFCSVVAKKGSGATILSGSLIFGLLVLPWWLFGSGQMMGNTDVERLFDAWARATPFVQLKHVLWTGFDEAIFGWQFIASLLAGAFFFGLAWLLFERFAGSSDEKPGLGFVAPVANEMTPVRALAGRAKIPALPWKDYHHVAGGSTAVVLKALVVAVIILVCLQILKQSGSERWELFAWFTTVLTSLFLSLCLALDASRIFKKEREQRTLSSLLTLPISTRRLVWEKVSGCLQASWPAFGGVAISLLILASLLAREVFSMRFNTPDTAEGIFFGACLLAYSILTALLLPVYIAWLSLRLRWGALPVGITIWFFGNCGLGSILGLVAREGAIVLLPIISFGLLLGFWSNIPDKLEQLAAEE